MDVGTSSSAPHLDYFPAVPGPRPPSVWRRRLRQDREQLPRFWPVIQNMVTQELRVRYQRSLLGFFWTLLNPLLMMVTLSWAFSQFVGGVPNYRLFLFSGMVPWGFMSGSLNECALCIIANEGLIRKIYLPKLVFPLAQGVDQPGDADLHAGGVILAAGAAGWGSARACDDPLAGGDRAVSRCSPWG